MSRQKSHFHQLKAVLLKHKERTHANLHRRHRHLRRILKKHQLKITDLRQKGARIATTGAIAGTILTSPGVFPTAKTQAKEGLPSDQKVITDEEKRKFLEKVMNRYGPRVLVSANTDNINSIEVEKLKESFPESIKQIAASLDKINPGQYEAEVEKLIQAKFNLKAKVSIDNKRLNVFFGPLGAEQHLPRFPGDNANQHSTDPLIVRSGITPGRGAWGLWTNNKNNLTPEQTEQEKYYIAAQTFLAPGWRENPKALYQWFKHRKVIVVNPRNSKAVVAVIGDAGPATWTGKNFGGSPEVMQTLESHDGRGRDSVFVLFVDDQENRIVLGPIEGGMIRVAEK